MAWVPGTSYPHLFPAEGFADTAGQGFQPIYLQKQCQRVFKLTTYVANKRGLAEAPLPKHLPSGTAFHETSDY
jgi:hypothetical protein